MITTRLFTHGDIVSCFTNHLDGTEHPLGDLPGESLTPPLSSNEAMGTFSVNGAIRYGKINNKWDSFHCHVWLVGGKSSFLNFLWIGIPFMQWLVPWVTKCSSRWLQSWIKLAAQDSYVRHKNGELFSRMASTNYFGCVYLFHVFSWNPQENAFFFASHDVSKPCLTRDWRRAFQQKPSWSKLLQHGVSDLESHSMPCVKTSYLFRTKTSR